MISIFKKIFGIKNKIKDRKINKDINEYKNKNVFKETNKAFCPYCKALLNKLPKRKTVCTSCG